MSGMEAVQTTGLSSSSSSTYEATKAAQAAGADPIHWHTHTSFRDCNYRQLHHQNGVSGLFHCRLLEAADLGERRYWSALALGPVKHLGLSQAHGPVSSCCTFSLHELSHDDEANTDDTSNKENSSQEDRKPSAKVQPPHAATQAAFVSPVVPHDNHPVWDDCQFEFPLRKGAFGDGARIGLCVQVQEAASAVDNLLWRQGNHCLLGTGTLDLTPLVRGETSTGQALPGVLDTWVNVTLERQDDDDDEEEEPQAQTLEAYGSATAGASKVDPLAAPRPSKSTKRIKTTVTGRVRLLVSYKPVGLEPQFRDIVALEAACRHRGSSASCAPVLDPLGPLTVRDRRGPYLLCEYRLRNHSMACVRLHRNAVFVLERQSMWDGVHNLALLPLDVALSTPVGQGVARLVEPLAHASRELVLPAALSVKLVWLAARTTGLGVWSGVAALGGTLWQEGSSSLTGGGSNNGQGRRRSDASERVTGTAKFVQL